MQANHNIGDYISPIKRKMITSHIIKAFSSLKIGPLQRTCPAISKWLLKSLFWSLIYIIGMIFTVKTCWNTCQSYSANQISTSVTASLGNEIQLPNITLCMEVNFPLYFSRISTIETQYTAAMYNFFDNHIKDGRFKFEPCKIPYLSTLLTMPSTATFNLTSGDVMSVEVFLVIQKYISMLYEFENLEMANKIHSSIFAMKLEPTI